MSCFFTLKPQETQFHTESLNISGLNKEVRGKNMKDTSLKLNTNSSICCLNDLVADLFTKTYGYCI